MEKRDGRLERKGAHARPVGDVRGYKVRRIVTGSAVEYRTRSETSVYRARESRIKPKQTKVKYLELVDKSLRISKVKTPKRNTRAMSEQHFDEYEHFNYDYDKHIFTGHGGKQRSKREATEHTNHNDPSGHSRKIVTKLMNSEHNKRQVDKSKA